MIKASVTGENGQKGLVIGLSRKNCEMLLEGKPIAFPMDTLATHHVDFVIVLGGESEEAIAEEVAKHFQSTKGTDA
jgi:hypothetical protein